MTKRYIDGCRRGGTTGKPMVFISLALHATGQGMSQEEGELESWDLIYVRLTPFYIFIVCYNIYILLVCSARTSLLYFLIKEHSADSGGGGTGKGQGRGACSYLIRKHKLF